MNESDFRECRKRCRRCVCLYSLWAGSCSSVSAYHDLVQQKEVWQSLFYYKKQSYDHLCGRSRTSDIVFEGIRNCRPGGSDFFQSSGGIFGLYDSVDRKCIIVFAGRDFMSLDVEADPELEAQLPAWIRRESADRDAADADGKRPVSAG